MGMTHTGRWLGVLLVCLLLGACGGGGGDGSTLGGISGPNVPAQGMSVAAASFDYNLTALNAIRAARTLPLFTRVAALDAFAQNATWQTMIDHIPHNYFSTFNGGCGADGFNTACAENQGGSNGWTPMPTNVAIDAILAAMMNEETLYPPGDPMRGHYETLVNPLYTRVGIGLAEDGAGRLYFTNDFSN